MTALYHSEVNDIVRLSASDAGPLGVVKQVTAEQLRVLFRADSDAVIWSPTSQFKLVARGSDWSELMAALVPFRGAWAAEDPCDYLGDEHWSAFQRAYDAIGGAHG